jgi:alpha-tubulin suppressor-like RCC1 family protein
MSIVIGAGVSFGPGTTVLASAPITLFAWGKNANGELGLGDTVYRSSPVQVGALGTWSKVTAGRRSTAAIKTDGTLWTWGLGQNGGLGLGDAVSRSSPVQVGALTTWDAVAVANPSMAAIKTDGTLWTWGRASYGQLGLGNVTVYSSPVQVGALTTWSKIASNSSSIAAIKTDGTLWVWGRNYAGALAQNDLVNRSSPVQVGVLTTWSSISGDTGVNSPYGSFIAVKTDGTMWSWGKNNGAQLGLGTPGNYNTVSRSSPTQIGALTTWGVGVQGDQWGFGIKTTGTFFTWGTAYSGDQADYRTLLQGWAGPTQVGTLTDWWSATNRASAGNRTGFVIKSDGALWTWGDNTYGALGRNNTANTSSPVQLGSLTTWTSISASDSVLAIVGP